MTDREIMQMALDALELTGVEYLTQKEIEHLDALEIALRARLAQPESEPFEYWNAVEGWVKIDEVRQHFDTAGCGTIYKTAGEDRVPLYAAPPKKEWVGLTHEEQEELSHSFQEIINSIDWKLKKKNGGSHD